MTKEETIKKLNNISECISDIAEELEEGAITEDDYASFAMALELYIYELKRVKVWSQSNY